MIRDDPKRSRGHTNPRNKEMMGSMSAHDRRIIDDGLRTGDIYTGDADQKKVGTSEMGDAIVERI